MDLQFSKAELLHRMSLHLCVLCFKKMPVHACPIFYFMIFQLSSKALVLKSLHFTILCYRLSQQQAHRCKERESFRIISLPLDGQLKLAGR